MQRRHQLMFALLLATLGAVWWAASLEEDEAPAKARKPRSAAPAQTAPATAEKTPRPPAKGKNVVSQSALLAELAEAQSAREALPDLKTDPFAPASFEPPPPKVEPPKPTAPPLRFKYLGRVNEGGRATVFLDDGGNMLVVRAGDTVAGQYRVVSIGERNMQFEYTPLQTPQTLNF